MANEQEQLVVALEARIRDFEKNFEKANQTATRNWTAIENRGRQAGDRLQSTFGKATSGVAGSFRTLGDSMMTAVGIGGVGMTAFLALAVKINGELAKLNDLAKRAGTSTDRLQEVKFAANLGGVSDQAFETGLDQSLRLLDEAQRDANSLKAIFDANGLSIRSSNGQLIQFDTLLERAAQLIAGAANESQKIKIAEMVGLGREWVRTLEGGPDAFRKTALEARGTGAVIDADVIRKAKEFDDAWAKAIVRFKAGITSALTDLASSFGDFWNKVLDSVPGADFIRRAFERMAGGLRGMTLPELEEALKRTVEQGIGDFEVARIQAEIDRRLGKQPLRIEVRPTVSKPTIIPSQSTGNEDAFSRALAQANKQIAVVNADTATVGLNSEAHERARMVAQLEEAAKKANSDAGRENSEVSDDQRRKISDLAGVMEAAARRNRQTQQSWEAFNDTLRFSGDLAVDFFDALADKSKSFADIVQSSMAIVRRAFLSAVVTGQGPLAGLLGMQSANGGVGGILGMAFGGARAGGGSVSPDKAFLVGERGPELFVPPNAGRIVPNQRLVVSSLTMNAPITVTVNATGGDARTNADLAQQVGKAVQDSLDARIAKAVRQQMRPGGMLAR